MYHFLATICSFCHGAPEHGESECRFFCSGNVCVCIPGHGFVHRVGVFSFLKIMSSVG